uniref:Uncharacterized protein n=1 Tax=Oryza punctata TaxID=4537 RepID=A0A0E0MD71_ORYPU
MANGEPRRTEFMCPSLYLAAHRGRVEDVMALLLQRRHGAHADAGGDRNQLAVGSGF